MTKSSKKRKGSSSSTITTSQPHRGAFGDSPTPTNTSNSSPRSLTLFSFDDQYQRYYSFFFNRFILDPKFLDFNFFEGETFDCYQVFQNSEVVDFMTLNCLIIRNQFESFITIWKFVMDSYSLRYTKYPLLLINPCSILSPN